MSANTLAIMKKDVVDIVVAKVREFQSHGELHLPANYSPENAMKSAWLTLQATVDRNKKPVLEVCTRDSIANALLDMVVQGLNPVKKQCYFIAYGSGLACQRSYFGTMAVTKRVAGVKDVYAQVVYKGDELQYEITRGRKQVVKHIQSLENIDNSKITAAYCVIEFDDGRPDYTEIMTLDQIKQAWKMSPTNPVIEKTNEIKPDSTHWKFTEEMCKKTVINRACKAYINSSNDNSLLIKHFNRSDEERDEYEVAEEIQANANKEYIDVTATIAPDEPETPDPEEGPMDLPATGTDGSTLGPDF